VTVSLALVTLNGGILLATSREVNALEDSCYVTSMRVSRQGVVIIELKGGAAIEQVSLSESNEQESVSDEQESVSDEQESESDE